MWGSIWAAIVFFCLEFHSVSVLQTSRSAASTRRLAGYSGRFCHRPQLAEPRVSWSGILSSHDMKGRAPDHGLEFLLAFDGRIHHLDKGYWIKFDITRRKATPERPHGLSYSFTLHAPDGTRLVGFDNAHDVRGRGSRFSRRDGASDHWHRTEKDPGRRYVFRDAETLIDNFFDEVERVLAERGVSAQVVRVDTSRRKR